eukprot:4072394-Pyramimonas_sp.AAC.1
METVLVADDAPLGSSKGMVSDREITHLRVRPRRRRPRADRAIPALIFDSQHYQHHVQKLLSETDTTNMNATTTWRAMKATMAEAAKKARGTRAHLPAVADIK